MGRISYIVLCDKCRAQKIVGVEELLNSAFHFCTACFSTSVVSRKNIIQVLRDNPQKFDRL